MEQGADYGWPECYFDDTQNQLVLVRWRRRQESRYLRGQEAADRGLGSCSEAGTRRRGSSRQPHPRPVAARALPRRTCGRSATAAATVSPRPNRRGQPVPIIPQRRAMDARGCVADAGNASGRAAGVSFDNGAGRIIDMKRKYQYFRQAHENGVNFPRETTTWRLRLRSLSSSRIARVRAHHEGKGPRSNDARRAPYRSAERSRPGR